MKGGRRETWRLKLREWMRGMRRGGRREKEVGKRKEEEGRERERMLKFHGKMRGSIKRELKWS